jgi:hypothetical protein
MKYFCFFFLVLAAHCQFKPATQNPGISAYFKPISISDTLHIEVSSQQDRPLEGDSIPNVLFFSAIPKALLEQIDYIADSAQAQVFGRGKFQLNKSITAYWVEIRQFWFQHHALFLYNSSTNTFTERFTVAEFYGGDGGQLITGSWLFDFDGDGKTDILRREIEHSIIPGEEEPIEKNEHAATLLLWRHGNFVETPLPDTTAAIRRFPIQGF